MDVIERCILKHILLCTDGTSSQAPLGLRQQLCQHLLSCMHTSQSIVHHVLYVVFITDVSSALHAAFIVLCLCVLVSACCG